MKTLFFLTLLSMSHAYAQEVFISTSFYEGLGEKFRVEKAVSFTECKEIKKAQKIFLHAKNELREVAFWDESGKIHEAGRLNLNTPVRVKVEEIFAGATRGESPCSKEVKPETFGSQASPQ